MNESKTERALPDWDLLITWVAVIETGSVLGASRLLQVSQAAVSQRIKLLETGVSSPLLDRTTRPAHPTTAGQRLYEHAKELLTSGNQMMESVRGVSRAKRLVVRFGCVDSFAASIGPILVKSLSSSLHHLRLWSGITKALEFQLENRELDLAVTIGQSPIVGMVRTPLFTEYYFVVVPASFEVRKLGSLTDLARNLPFIRYSSRSLTGQQVDEYLMRNGDSLERTCEFDTTDPLLSLVSSGMGFALTTPLCIWQSRHFIPGIRVLPVTMFSRQGRAYPKLSRGFVLNSREGELGNLPNEVRDVIRIAVEKQISVEISERLMLTTEAFRMESDNS